jgi:adenine/guanine/hypoxanthine permease
MTDVPQPLGSNRSDDAQDVGPYRWFVAGDINGFFGLMFDNLTVMSFVAGIMIFAFKYPADIVFTKMFPGTALGVLFGDLVYTYMAFKLAKKTGRQNVTAMPLGLDTPSSIGIALAVLGPCFIQLKAGGMPEREAAMVTWYVGMATMLNIGLIKLVFSFFGSWLQRVIPTAGLLGSLAGIGLVLIGLIPMVDIFRLPIVGLFALGLIFYTLVAGIRLPGNFPGVAAAVLGGTAIFYGMGAAGVGPTVHPQLDLAFHLPLPDLNFVKYYSLSLPYLPVAFPFAILTVIGGVNVTESARLGGDDYDTRTILLTEAAATLVAGLFGGVAQSTPYIGQPAYKAMGSRSGYTVLTGLFIGLGGCMGFISFFVEAIPRAVLAPILIFVALDIVAQAYQACKPKHAPAVALAHIPTVARLLAIFFGTWLGAHPDIAGPLMLKADGPGLPDVLVITALGNGFILTGMLWGGMLVELIDRNLNKASFYLLILAGLSFFGVIHSSAPDGNMYNPINLPAGPAHDLPFQFAAGYLVLAVLFGLLGLTPESKEPAPENSGHGGHFG